MKIASIQYLRGLAALLVVVAHNASLVGGDWTRHIPGALGVDVFFIISGFIMTLITYQSADPPASFITKRFFRIWPIFFIVWLISFLFVYQEKSLSQMACVLYFCLQDYSRPGPTFGYSALGPPWTLSYEIMFYLVFTVSMSLSYRYRSYICTMIFIVSCVGFQVFYNGSFDFSSQSSPNIVVTHGWQAWIKVMSNTIVFEFITGMMLAELVVMNKLPALTPFWRNGTRVTLLIVTIIAYVVGPQAFGINGGFWLALVIMIGVIMLSYRSQARGNGLLIFLGNISYSLYLVHYPLMVFLSKHLPHDATRTEKVGVFILSVTGSIVMASILFKLIETPSIQAGKKIARILSAKLKLP